MAEPRWFRALDLIIEECQRRGSPEFRKEFRRRSASRQPELPRDRGLVRATAVAIAYSQAADSRKVGELIRTEIFPRAFCNFDLKRLAKHSQKWTLKAYWRRLSAMRFRGKVESIIRCARIVRRIRGKKGSFRRYLATSDVPSRLRSPKDVDRFWERFEALRLDLKARDMPFFGSTTSLLQLLLDLGYDSVKPDSVIMRLSRRIGIVDGEKGDRRFRGVVRSIQEYSVARRMRPGAVDWAMLAFGNQREAGGLLDKRFCPNGDPCFERSCPVGRRRLCSAIGCP